MKIIPISDLSISELDVYARLSERELLRLYEPQPGLFIAESPNCIIRALNAGYDPVSFLMEARHVDGEMAEALAMVASKDVPVYTAEFDVLTELTGFKLTRGALCCFKRKPVSQARDTIELTEGVKRVAVLEDVVNPTNVGAIFRSAAALGMDAVLLTEGCSDPLYRRAIRVSMGTVFQVPWTWIGKSTARNEGELPEYIAVLKKLGFKTAAMALSDNSVSISNEALKSEEKLAIILGTEGEGLKQTSIDSANYTVKIPMTHGVDSLNVAAASAVAFWEISGLK